MSKKQIKLKVGDVVKLMSDHYEDDIDNPCWGKEYGKVKGKVVFVEGGIYDPCSYEVDWDNGISNSYEEGELELVGSMTKNMYNKTCKKNNPSL